MRKGGERRKIVEKRGRKSLWRKRRRDPQPATSLHKTHSPG